jgi:hypothetical protein|tara:strand:+ start:565 stop:933 length:369 start_codon:yes stop_codon:yes gene_type:complete
MKIKTLATLALLMGSSVSMAECMMPEAPTLPQGATSTMEDMIAGQSTVKKFQADNIAYMGCLEKSFNEAEAASKKGTKEDKAAATAAYDNAVNEYNNAVSKEEEVAGQFNTEIREYKAANPS